MNPLPHSCCGFPNQNVSVDAIVAGIGNEFTRLGHKGGLFGKHGLQIAALGGCIAGAHVHIDQPVALRGVAQIVVLGVMTGLDSLWGDLDAAIEEVIIPHAVCPKLFFLVKGFLLSACSLLAICSICTLVSPKRGVFDSREWHQWPLVCFAPG